MAEYNGIQDSGHINVYEEYVDNIDINHCEKFQDDWWRIGAEMGR